MLKLFRIIAITWSCHLLSRTISVWHIFFIDRTLEPISADVINIVTISTKRDWKTLKISYLHLVKMHPNFHLSYVISVHKSKNVMITLQKYPENPLESVVVFKPGIRSLSTCLSVGIEIVPPFSTTVQPSTSPRAIQKCFRAVKSQCPRVDT